LRLPSRDARRIPDRTRRAAAAPLVRRAFSDAPVGRPPLSRRRRACYDDPTRPRRNPSVQQRNRVPGAFDPPARERAAATAFRASHQPVEFPMKFFLDSAKLDEIDLAYRTFGIDGVTTNPRHVQASGKPFKVVLRDIGAWLADHGLASSEQFPVSVEINPHLSLAADMVREARTYAALNRCFVIKLPCTGEGIAASRELEREGIRTNVTLVFSASQALPVAKNGAMFVSPFVGWKEESGDDTSQFVGDIVSIYRTYGFKTQVIVAALRNGKHIVDAARMGAHIVTCGLAVYQAGFEHPYTRKGLEIFQDAWDKTVAG
jgi:transaldolase